MPKPRIKYRKGYKYQLAEEYVIQLPYHPLTTVIDEFLMFTVTGHLTIRKGYAWDGPSGPTIDTPNFLRGSLVHDALYQLMREKLINHDAFRALADYTLQQLCLEDGMWSLRAWWVYVGVRWGGHPAADPRYKQPIMTAP